MRKFFKNLLKPQKDNAESQIEEDFKYLPSKDDLVEEKFTKNFTNNGGKFLYASNKDEFQEYFNTIISENKWNDKSILCLNENFLDDYIENIQLEFNKTNLNSHILVTSCEFLVANDGSILVSAKQIQSYKIKDIPNNIIVFAKTSQLSRISSLKKLVFSNDDLTSDIILNDLQNLSPDLIVLAGFLKKIPEKIVDLFRNKIVNIHPSLLPKYGGKGMFGINVHKAVIENNEEYSGFTIHYVNKNYDEGDIIFQKNIRVNTKSPEELAKKILVEEHKFYPQIIENILDES